MINIPKIIHYCWFGGGEMPESAFRCIESWKKYCPDYEIVEWNEDNFDLSDYTYAKEAYEAKKWAFVSDVVRLYALVVCGGIYMDTDVELIRPLDDLLKYEAISGFESPDRIPTGLMACRKDHPLFTELLHEYDGVHFIKKDGSYDLTTNVTRITEYCLKYGLMLNGQKQTVKSFTVFPSDYFCPKDYETGKVHITENTYSIHHFDGSWWTEEQKTAAHIASKLKKLLPMKMSKRIGKGLSAIRYRGLGLTLHEFEHWIVKRRKDV